MSTDLMAFPPEHALLGEETPEKRARRLFDEMARNIGREAVNHLKSMYPLRWRRCRRPLNSP